MRALPEEWRNCKYVLNPEERLHIQDEGICFSKNLIVVTIASPKRGFANHTVMNLAINRRGCECRNSKRCTASQSSTDWNEKFRVLEYLTHNRGASPEHLQIIFYSEPTAPHPFWVSLRRIPKPSRYCCFSFIDLSDPAPSFIITTKSNTF